MPDEQNQPIPISPQQESTSKQVPNPVLGQQPPTQSINGQNTSGMGSSYPTPPGVAGWGWGPFFLNWIWAIGNSVWIGLLTLIPYVGVIMAIILGVKGREWAWQAKKWESVESFNKTQRKWSIVGILLIGVGLLIIPILVVIVIISINPVGRVQEAVASKANSDVRAVGAAISLCVSDQTAKGTQASVIYSKTMLDPATGKGGCADSSNLTQGKYISSLPYGVKVTNSTNKVCAYEATTTSPVQYASWDSSQGQVLTVPNGTTSCI